MDIPSPLAVERDDRYDWLMVVCAAWLLVGLFADGWSHYHDVRESFFTPYHAVLYAGFFANVLAVGVPLLANLRRGLRWPNALAPGYDLTAIGVAIFTIGVIPDFTWHRIFGIEEGIDVLISPTHLFMGIGMALILLGPARAAFARTVQPVRLEDQAPMLVSLGLFLAMIEFTLQFAFDPGVSSSNAPLAPDAGGTTTNLAFFLLPFTYYKEALGITIVIIHTALLAGFALFAVRNDFTRSSGALTILFTLPALLMAVLLSSGALSVYVPVVVAHRMTEAFASTTNRRACAPGARCSLAMFPAMRSPYRPSCRPSTSPSRRCCSAASGGTSTSRSGRCCSPASSACC